MGLPLASKPATMTAMSPYSPHDTLANRLIVIGCLLLIAPCVLLAVAAVTFGWPVVWSILPLGQRPVVAARPGESLVLVAGLEGKAGTDPTESIYQALLEAAKDTSYQGSIFPRIRMGRLADVPLSERDARSLSRDYDASMVLWGAYDASTEYEVTCSILNATTELEPEQFTVTLLQGDPAAQDDLAKLVLAIMLYHTGDYYNADRLLNSLSGTLDPVIVTFYQVEVQREIGDFSRALAAVDATLSAGPENALLLVLKASVLSDLARYDEALEAASASQKLEPDRVETYLIRGAIYQKMGDAGNALTDANHVLEQAPGNSAALRARVQAYEKLGDMQAALSDYAALIEREPDRYQTFLERAQLYSSHEDEEEALADFERALALADQAEAPNVARRQVLEARALAYRAFGQHSLALDDYDRLDSIDAAHIERLLERGMTYWEMGDRIQAERQWETYIRNTGNNLDASGYNNLAWSLAMTGYYQPALDYSNRSLKLDPREPNSLHTRGYIHLGLKQYQAALDDFDKAMQNHLNYDAIYRDMADAYFGIGRYEQAIDAYRTYLHLNPDTEDRYRVEQRLKAAQAAFQP